MKDAVREKIALIILVILVAIAGFAIITYFAVGRSWSVAATLMDDAVGRMSGYTALIYHAEDDDAMMPDGTDASELDPSMPSLIKQNDVPADADTIGLRIMSYYSLVNPDGLKAVDPQAVLDLYKEKDTNVSILDVSKYGSGSEPEVIEVDDKKIGIFYAVGYKSNYQIAKIVDKLHRDGAEAILCITPRLSTLQSTAGINAVLIPDIDDEIASGSVRDGDTLITALPAAGKVGVILFSSNNVATGRVIDAL